MRSVRQGAQLLRTYQLTATQNSRHIHPRWGHVIPLPPRVKIPFAEKAALGSFLVLGMISIPVWVFYNLEYYKTGGKKVPPPPQPEDKDMVEETINTLQEQEVVARGQAQNY